ncbi:MAG: hypothetical protein RMY28_025955 [Nostoc sp. ChiSLP01]|nr:hypothetical protein [Nostoc sp. CmiSLP01]MDZ8283502.1 hypothetical protein [Nostoc sp. ChiSLP01]
MKHKFIPFCVTLSIISVGNLQVQACKPGNQLSTDYMRRDDNRCEGIKSRSLVSGGINFISFTTRNITEFSSQVKLQIPKISNEKPEVVIFSHQRPYQLDNLTPQFLISETSYFTFNWSNYVLIKEKILPKNLRARAWIKQDSEQIYLPVQLQKTSGQYEFVLFSKSPAIVSTLEILPYKSPYKKNIKKFKPITSLGGEIIFNWDARNIPSGRYKLKFAAKLKGDNSPEKPRFKYITFEHKPQWLQ